MKKADWILISCIVFLAGIFWLWCSIDRSTQNGGQVVITINGKEYQRLTLTESTRIELPAKDGNSVLVISDGKCYMESAYCPDQICVKHKPIQAKGESIICLPYKIVISIEGSGEAAYDN